MREFAAACPNCASLQLKECHARLRAEEGVELAATHECQRCSLRFSVTPPSRGGTRNPDDEPTQ